MPLASGHPDGRGLTMIKAQTLSSITLKDITAGTLSPPFSPLYPSTHFLLSASKNTPAKQAKSNTLEVSGNLNQNNIKNQI